VTLHAWRIFKPKHAASAFTGEGARLFGGRWNSKGTAVIYTAGSVSLATLEMLVHLQAPHLLDAYLLARVTFADSLVENLAPKLLPADWRADPAPAATMAFGDRWVAEGRSAVLRVPSAIIESEYNYLLNPAHPAFRKIAIARAEPFGFDPRLVKTTPAP
jgi:RES domain-containing protein